MAAPLLAALRSQRTLCPRVKGVMPPDPLFCTPTFRPRRLDATGPFLLAQRRRFLYDTRHILADARCEGDASYNLWQEVFLCASVQSSFLL